MSDDTTEETKPEADSQSRPRRKAGAVMWHGLRVLVLMSVVPLVFALIAGLGLIDRDIAAPSWIKSRVAAAASDVMGGGAVSFGEIYINIGRDLHPRVRLRNTEVTDANGAPIARIAAISGLMSPRGLLFQQEVLMQNIVLSGALIDLRRNADGTVAMAFGAGNAPVDQAGRWSEMLDQADQTLEAPAFAALETIRAENLTIAYTDARADRAWTVDGGTIDIDLRDGTTALRADMALLSGGAGVTTLRASYESPRGSRSASLSVAIDDAIAADIATQSEALGWLQGFDAPISANLRTTLDDAGTLGDLSATLELGKGALRPNDATRPVSFDSAKMYLTFEPAISRLQFDQIEVVSERGQFQAEGQAFLTSTPTGLAESLVAQVRFRDIAVNAGDGLRAALALPTAQVDFRLEFEPFNIDVGQIHLTGDGFEFLGDGTILATPEGWQTAFDGAVSPMDNATVTQLAATFLPAWQEQMMAATVTWGSLDDLRVGLRHSPGQELMLAGDFQFADATILGVTGAPPITGGAGVASFAQNRLAILIEEGRITPETGGPLNVAGSSMIVPDVMAPRPPVSFDMVFDGSLTATMSLMDAPPFGYTRAAGLVPDFAAGRARSRLQINMPMDPNWREGELRYRLTSDLLDFDTTSIVPGRRITARRLEVRADNDTMTISGPATFDGLPVTGTWTKPFDGTGNSTMSADLTLSQQFLDTFDIALPPGSVSGSGPARIDIRIPWQGSSQFTLTSRLQGLGVAIPPIGWSKPRSEAGSLRVVGTLGDTPTVDRLAISGGGLDVEGRLILNGDGSLDRAIFSKMRVGNWLNAPITLRGRGGNRPYAVSLQGGTLDLRQARFGAGGGESGPVSIALDRLQVTEGIALTRFAGEFDGSGGFSGTFTGRLNGIAPLRGTVAPRNGRSAVRLQSDDAGGMIRAAGLADNALGGTFDLTLLPSGGEGTFDGTLAIRQLRVRDAPGIAALLDAVSVVGLLQQLDGQGLSFEEVDARFRLTPTQVILAEASAVGPGLGISLDGIYTLASGQVDFQGVISPFYLINAIGSVFTRRGEGLIGFNFNILGSASAPQVSVNPLSAFTPGMFREIFRRPPPVLTE